MQTKSMRARSIVCSCLICCSLCFTSQAQQQIQMQRQSANEGARPAQPKTADNQVYGLKMLEIAEADAGALEGAMRAYAQLQIARGYAKSDRKKALELFESALTSARNIPDGPDGPTFQQDSIEEQILQAMIPFGPSRVDELLSSVTPRARVGALRSLLSYYEKNKQQDHALEVVYRIADESEMPYGVAIRMMAKMPPDQDLEFQRLFNASLASYRDHKHQYPSNSDLGGMVVRYWNRLPKSVVREAIDELLRQAQEADKAQNNLTFSFASEKGSVSFNSNYQWRLFQLIPVLKNIDESGAEDLLKKNAQMSNLLSQYPQGMQSIAAQQQQSAFMQGGNAGGGGGASYAIRGDAADLPLRMEEVHQAQKIVADSALHPQDALANAATITDNGARCQALEGIARTNVKKNSSVARSALSKLMDTVDKVEPLDRQTGMLRNAARLYMELADPDSAKKVVERGLALADKLYSADSNADDPNKAFKFFWPSAVAYTTFLREAAKISPEYAMTVLKEIRDPEMKAVAETALACEWMGVPAGIVTTVVSRKNQTNTMIED